MAIQHRTDLYKVTRYDGYGNGGVSALIRQTTQALIDYGLARIGSGVFIRHSNAKLPALLYANLEAALAFKADHHNRKVYRVETFGELLPITRVLDIRQAGWFGQAEAFWEAVKNGQNLDGFTTRAAPEGTVALWGVLHLKELVQPE